MPTGKNAGLARLKRAVMLESLFYLLGSSIMIQSQTKVSINIMTVYVTLILRNVPVTPIFICFFVQEFRRVRMLNFTVSQQSLMKHSQTRTKILLFNSQLNMSKRLTVGVDTSRYVTINYCFINSKQARKLYFAI